MINFIGLRRLSPLLILFFAGCASTVQSTQVGDYTVIRSIGYGVSVTTVPHRLTFPNGSVRVGIKKVGNVWSLEPDADLSDPRTELIWIHRAKKQVGLATSGMTRDHPEDPLDACFPKNLPTRQEAGYNACTSQLTRPRGAFGSLVSAVAIENDTDPIATSYQTDTALLAAAISHLDLSAVYEQQAQRLEASSANRAEEIKLAVQSMREMLRDQELERQRLRQEAIEREEALMVATMDRRQEYYSNLSVGDRTVCGLVVEINDPLVSIQFRDGLRWVRIDELIHPEEFLEFDDFNRIRYCSTL